MWPESPPVSTITGYSIGDVRRAVPPAPPSVRGHQSLSTAAGIKPALCVRLASLDIRTGGVAPGAARAADRANEWSEILIQNKSNSCLTNSAARNRRPGRALNQSELQITMEECQ
ncbi:hypothetical protein EVAR_87936_1 [Eumeta japonica]|uniref:Uncharacterized protein n=1 Tax=Eumeta variegata TaxID=151549 RepID=A0A4C2AA99_EUMVA|nr:hypothetical protein EVAR_87936_1 [Eumeta japonica]